MTTPSASDAGTTRRQLLRASGITAATAAFLAACGTKNKEQPGLSGEDPSTTSVAPTVPIGTPSQAALDEQTTQLRTATSLELLAAQLYQTYGSKLTDADWKAASDRFATDHTAAAAEFTNKLPAKDQVTEPNAYIQKNSVDPVADGLTSDGPILDFLSSVESSIAATYVVAVQLMTTSDLRSLFAAHAGSAARRDALMSNRGAGAVSNAALLPITDLISNDAYVPVTTGDTTTTGG